MCWTIAGADAMARLRALRANGELQEWLDRQLSGPARVPTRTDALATDVRSTLPQLA